jgi:hypothetical protein
LIIPICCYFSFIKLCNDLFAIPFLCEPFSPRNPVSNLTVPFPFVSADAEISSGHQQDVLTCGFCQKNFLLSDIVKFIQHKVLACNKENYNYHCDPHDSDDGGEFSPLFNFPIFRFPTFQFSHFQSVKGMFNKGFTIKIRVIG